MNRKTLEERLEALPISATTDPEANKIISALLNIIEALFRNTEELEGEVQQLKNKINQLNGEQGKPDIKGKNCQSKDFSSEQERQGEASVEEDDETSKEDGETSEENENKKTKEKRNRTSKLPKIKIDRVVICTVDRDTLPEDAVFKGLADVVIQDIKIITDNVKYRKEVFYSPSLGKTFTADLPSELIGKGEYGVGIRTLIPLLKSSECNLSESCIVKFFRNFGIEISAAYLSNQWTKGYDILHQEKDDIYEAGLSSGSYQQIDDTGSRVNGENCYVQILCNQFYTAYFTTERKDRLTVLDVFRHFAPREFLYNTLAMKILAGFSLSKKSLLKIHNLLEQDKVFDEPTFNRMLEELAPGPTQRTRIKEACAIAAYRQQTDWPVIEKLVCDDAPQFKLLTEYLALCWVHEGRHYKKLNPIASQHITLLDNFLTLFWCFYHQLNEYKKNPDPVKADFLYKEFDQLFSTKTGYVHLDERITLTAAKREQLLLVLEYPELSLHNNDSELGARAEKRDQDVSLHTRSGNGTEIKDSVLTLTQTARKLGVRVYDYLRDRVSGEYKLPSLAQLIRNKSQEEALANSGISPVG